VRIIAKNSRAYGAISQKPVNHKDAWWCIDCRCMHRNSGIVVDVILVVEPVHRNGWDSGGGTAVVQLMTQNDEPPPDELFFFPGFSG